MGILDAPSLTKLADRDLLLGLDADHWDLFNRPDGSFTNGLLTPAGASWVVTGDVSGSVMGPELKTLSRALTYDNRANAARAKAYMWVTGAPFRRFSAAFSFGPGSTTNATIGFIISPKSTADTSGIPTSNGPSGVATNSIHGSFGPNSWSFLFFKAGVQSPVFANSGVDGTWSVPLEVDKKYWVSIERTAVDAMRIWLPTTRVGNLPRYLDVTDASILARTGVPDKIADLWPETGVQTAVIEFFNPLTPSLATDRFGTFHAVSTCARGARPYLLSATKGAAAGVASLDSTTRVPFSQVPDAWRPTGYQSESRSRRGYMANSAVLTSGTLRLEAVYLTAGVPVTALDFMASTTAAGTPTNQWAALYDVTTLGLLATSADQTTGAWAANTLKSFPITYTPTVSGLYYAALLVAATTVPTLLGINSNATLSALPPILCGNSTTGLTTPATAPATAVAPPGSSVGCWCGVKL